MEKTIGDRRAARICSIIANVNRDKKKKPTPFSEEDFMPQEKKKKKKVMTNDEIANVCNAICIAYGGEVK